MARTLAEEGYIHCSFAEQVAATAARFYGDVDEVVRAAHRCRPADAARSSSRTSSAAARRSLTSTADRPRTPSSTHRVELSPDELALGCRVPGAARPPRRRSASRSLARCSSSSAASSATSRSRLANRSGSSAPASIAARTAQPGSWSCLQSRKRQWSISSNTSAKARSMPSPDSHRLTARTPGVSISQPSPGSAQQLGGDRRVPPAVVAAADLGGRLHAPRRAGR